MSQDRTNTNEVIALPVSLRDYFAAKAMQGLVANEGYYGNNLLNAESAYDIADAMLKVREK